jgi:hypothetical protein
MDDYNADVDKQQEQHGKLGTVEPMGSRIKWRAWEQSV